MPRTALLASAAAVLAAASVGVGVIGSPVASADAAAPFSLTKSQFTQVQKTSTAAMKKSNANAKAIKALKTTSVAVAGVQGPKGDPGAPGGFDPTKVFRVNGPAVPVESDDDAKSYSMDCPPGTIVLSAGYSVPTSSVEKAFRVAVSSPHSDLGGWSFRFAYQTLAGSSVNVTPYIVCVQS